MKNIYLSEDDDYKLYKKDEHGWARFIEFSHDELPIVTGCIIKYLNYEDLKELNTNIVEILLNMKTKIGE